MQRHLDIEQGPAWPGGPLKWPGLPVFVNDEGQVHVAGVADVGQVVLELGQGVFEQLGLLDVLEHSALLTGVASVVAAHELLVLPVLADVLRETVGPHPAAHSDLDAGHELLQDEVELVLAFGFPALQHEHHVGRRRRDVGQRLVRVAAGLGHVALGVGLDEVDGLVVGVKLSGRHHVEPCALHHVHAVVAVQLELGAQHIRAEDRIPVFVVLLKLAHLVGVVREHGDVGPLHVWLPEVHALDQATGDLGGLAVVLANPLLDLMAFQDAAQAEVNQGASGVDQKDFHSGVTVIPASDPATRLEIKMPSWLICFLVGVLPISVIAFETSASNLAS